MWLYLEAKYIRTTQGMLVATMGNFTRWKQNPAHTMEEVPQEIEPIADLVLNQAILPWDSFLLKHQSLSCLPDEYESARPKNLFFAEWKLLKTQFFKDATNIRRNKKNK